MDNFTVMVEAQSYEVFEATIALAMGEQRARGWQTRVDENGTDRIIIYDDLSAEPDLKSFPQAMKVKTTAAVLWEWVQTIKPPSKRPNVDGNFEKGFRIDNNPRLRSGPVEHEKSRDNTKAILRVRPIWAVNHY